MHVIFKHLTSRLDAEVVHLISKRIELLQSDLQYKVANADKNLQKTLGRGWTLKSFEIIFILNSFYQIILSPLAASATIEHKSDIGSKIPIRYGNKIVFDEERNKAILEMFMTYRKICFSSNIPEKALKANRVDDIFFALTRHEDE